LRNEKPSSISQKDPDQKGISANHLNDLHTKVLDKLRIRGRYAFYSWKHTGAVQCVQAGLNVRDIQNQMRHSSLDMTQRYLEGLRVMQSEDLKNKYPKL
jgi:integrase